MSRLTRDWESHLKDETSNPLPMVVDNPGDGDCLHWSILFFLLTIGYIPSLMDTLKRGGCTKEVCQSIMVEMRNMMADWVSNNRSIVEQNVTNVKVSDNVVKHIRTDGWNTSMGDQLPTFYAVWLYKQFNIALQITSDKASEGYYLLNAIKDNSLLETGLLMGTRRNQKPQKVMRLLRTGNHYRVIMLEEFKFIDCGRCFRKSH